MVETKLTTPNDSTLETIDMAALNVKMCSSYAISYHSSNISACAAAKTGVSARLRCAMGAMHESHDSNLPTLGKSSPSTAIAETLIPRESALLSACRFIP